MTDGHHLLWRETEGKVIEAAGTPEPDLVDPDGACFGWDIVLLPGENRQLSLSVQRHDSGAGVPVPRNMADKEGHSEIRAWSVPVMIEADDPRLERFLFRSLADLSGLLMSTHDAPDEIFLGAGVPWFLTLFGRDSIWAARMLLPLGSELAFGTLATLARRQGAAVNRLTGEEPGEILHELRRAR